jgi:tetratricopeptide (TPR) repeat protein
MAKRAGRRRKITAPRGQALLALCALLALAAPHAAAHQEILDQLEDLNERIEKEPGAAQLYLERGEVHRIRRDWDAAVADYRVARELSPDLTLVDFCWGRMELAAGHPVQAVSMLARYLLQRPEDGAALEVRGRAHLALAQYGTAAGDFERALELTPEDVRPSLHLYLERARAQRAAGEPAAALQGLEEGLARLGGAITLELEALELERELGRTDAALARLQRLAGVAQRPEPWLVRRGALLEQAGRAAEARQAYRQAREGLQELPRHVQARAGMVQLADQIDEALLRLSAEATGGGNG